MSLRIDELHRLRRRAKLGYSWAGRGAGDLIEGCSAEAAVGLGEGGDEVEELGTELEVSFAG